MTETWVISWQNRGARFVLDVDDEQDAHRIAVLLAESGREEVRIVRAELKADVPPETKERIWQRIEARIRAQKGAPHG